MCSRRLWLPGLAALGLVLSLIGPAGRAGADERTEAFDRDPGWDGYQHRSTAFAEREVVQDFGYRLSRQAQGRHAGEIGGLITPAAEPAYYAQRIKPLTLDDRLSASGTFLAAGPQFHVLVGFFHSDTLNEWRTPNSLVLRFYGRGPVFYAYLEYATARWRAGGDDPQPFPSRQDPVSGGRAPVGFAAGRPHHWTLDYDPAANQGQGSLTATVDGVTAICHLAPGHRADGAVFNRCGLLTVQKQVDTGGEVWLDDLVINGTAENFDRDPGWEAVHNQRRYVTGNVRPRFDFGYSPTHYAGGRRAGELGGLVFRGDCRDPARLACYGDRLEPLTLNGPLRAGGKICLRRGVSDSTTLLGFYHAEHSLQVSDSQASGWPRSFLGVAVEGPSREGFLLYPAYRTQSGESGYADGDARPHILPDGASHDWTLTYTPSADSEAGEIVMTLDEHRIKLPVAHRRDAPATVFNRFGLVTTWIDGNGQHVYFDDLTYTCRH